MTHRAFEGRSLMVEERTDQNAREKREEDESDVTEVKERNPCK